MSLRTRKHRMPLQLTTDSIQEFHSSDCFDIAQLMLLRETSACPHQFADR